MERLVEIKEADSIFPKYRNTPIGHLLEYHNLDRSYEDYKHATLLVGMCMDNRKRLQIPPNFAYIIRTGGANLKNLEFNVSYAVAVGNIKHIVVIGHNKCGMSNLVERKEKFINGLVENAGWDKESAEDHYNQFAPIFDIGDEVDFTISEANRLRQRYPKITVAPLYYKLEDNRLYLVNEE